MFTEGSLVFAGPQHTGPGARGGSWDSCQCFAATDTQLLHRGLCCCGAASVQSTSSVPFTQGGLEGWKDTKSHHGWI